MNINSIVFCGDFNINNEQDFDGFSLDSCVSTDRIQHEIERFNSIKFDHPIDKKNYFDMLTFGIMLHKL